MGVKVLIIEGADGLGKTVISEKLGRILDWNLVHQPNPYNILGFIRNEVKEKENWGVAERQLLHTCSHLIDYLTVKPPVIFDRNWISTWVYSRAMGLDSDKLNVIVSINRKVFETSYPSYKVFVFTAEEPFTNTVKDIYERLTDWKELNDLYKKSLSDLKISNGEILDVSNKSIPEVILEILLKSNLNVPIENFLSAFMENESVNEILWGYKIVPGTRIEELRKEVILEMVKEGEDV